MSPRKFVLVHATARANAIQAIKQAEDGMVVKVEKPKRSLAANAKFHAICHDLAKSGIQWAGKTWSYDAWKVLLISGHAAATKEDYELVRGLEGEPVSIRESSAAMTGSRMASLLEYAQAFGAMHAIGKNNVHSDD